MVDLKYRHPGTETLEMETEKLWQVMVSSEESGCDINPASIEFNMSMDKQEVQLQGSVKYMTFLHHILAIENVSLNSRVVSPERDDSKSLRRIS